MPYIKGKGYLRKDGTYTKKSKNPAVRGKGGDQRSAQYRRARRANPNFKFSQVPKRINYLSTAKAMFAEERAETKRQIYFRRGAGRLHYAKKKNTP